MIPSSTAAKFFREFYPPRSGSDAEGFMIEWDSIEKRFCWILARGKRRLVIATAGQAEIEQWWWDQENKK